MTWARYQDSFMKLTFYPAYMEFQLFDDEYLFDDITLYRYCIEMQAVIARLINEFDFV